MTLSTPTERPDWLDSAARVQPDRVALSFDSQEWTFARLLCAVDTAATNMLRLPGVLGVPGCRIGVLAENCPGIVFAFHAARRIGAEFVPLSWRLTVSELAWQIQEAEIAVLITDGDRFETGVAACAALPTSVVPITALERPVADIAAPVPRTIDRSRAAAVLFTSGTSGQPKGVRLTFGNLWSSALASALHLGLRRDDVWLAVLPLFHIGGLSILLRGLIGGTPVILHERFDPAAANAAIDDGATLVSLVPTMLQRMFDQRGDRPYPPTFRAILLGGSAAPPTLIEASLRRGVPVAPTYGLTETASQVTTLLPAQVRLRPGSSGLPLPGTRVRIGADGLPSAPTSQLHHVPSISNAARKEDMWVRASHDDTNVSPDSPRSTGEIGHIEIKGPTVFAGYLGEEGKLTDRTADGWFQTGDLGYLDDEGFLYVVDRRDDLIVSGGENIYPAEIESVLFAHGQIDDAGVVGVPDETWGARPAAAVVWQSHINGDQEALLAHCRQLLAPFKVPALFVPMRELPRTPSGKLLRRKLRELVLERLPEVDRASRD